MKKMAIAGLEIIFQMLRYTLPMYVLLSVCRLAYYAKEMKSFVWTFLTLKTIASSIAET